MNVRTVMPPSNRLAIKPARPKSQRGFIRLSLLIVISAVVIYGGVGILSFKQVQAEAPVNEIKTATADYCLATLGKPKADMAVLASPCNGSDEQNWTIRSHQLKIDSKYCLVQAGQKVSIAICNTKQFEQWQRQGVGLQNIKSSQCLVMTRLGQPVTVSACQDSSINQSWTPQVWPGAPLQAISSPACNQSIFGQRVACFAKRQWLAWQIEPDLHKVLLSDYTNHNDYEEWCADFISYVYKEAGAPFKQGERNGWDEYNANDIRYMGFNYHPADSQYVPRAGDVAFFDYSGGHVEIVIKGGSHPVFIYGDSAITDPISGNGDMAENQITSDGSAGQVIYYLSPLTP